MKNTSRTNKKNKDKRKLSPISKATVENMTQYKESVKHTHMIPLGEHVSLKIRKQKTIFADREAETGIDIRKFLNNKYPFKGGKQGILIPERAWAPFVQAVIDFTQSAYPEIFYDEQQPAQQQENVIHQDDQVVKNSLMTPEQQARYESVRYVGQEKSNSGKQKNIEELDWLPIIKKGKQ